MENRNGIEVLDWKWEWDGNGNDSTGMGGIGNNNRSRLVNGISKYRSCVSSSKRSVSFSSGTLVNPYSQFCFYPDVYGCVHNFHLLDLDGKHLSEILQVGPFSAHSTYRSYVCSGREWNFRRPGRVILAMSRRDSAWSSHVS